MAPKVKHKDKIVLITGSAGLLGTALLQRIPENIRVAPTYFTNPQLNVHPDTTTYKLDITNEENVLSVFKNVKPTYVIHASSLGNVDYCETHREEAYKINVVGTKNIIKGCEKYGSKLIFISSNAVFDGLHAPYDEDSLVLPVNYYGETKAIGEDLVSDSGLQYAIVRLVLMYGWNNPSERQNPVTWLLDKLRQGEHIKLVDDTYTNPILNTQAALAVWSIIDKNKTGIFHIAGKDRVNRYEFGISVAEIFGFKTELIQKVDSSYFKGIANRMPDTTYITKRMENELMLKPLQLIDGLRYMKNHKELSHDK